MSDEILMQEIEKLKQENARLLREWHKADLAKINAEKGTCYHFALNPYDLENMQIGRASCRERV